MKKILKLLFIGISWGCTICMFILITGALTVGDKFIDMTAMEFIKQAIGSIIVGIGFVGPTFIYDNERLSKLQQTCIHMGIGLLIYFLVAFNVGWIPVEYGIGASITCILLGVAFSFIIWFGFYLYNKAEAKKINDKIKKI